MDLTKMSNDDLTTAHSEKREALNALFALEEFTPEQVTEGETIAASLRDIEAEQARRVEVAKDAQTRFAALRASFDTDEADEADETEETEETEEADEADEDTEETEETEEGTEVVEAAAEETDETDDKPTKKEPDAVSASVNPAMTQPIKASAAKRVGRKVARPEVPASAPVTITAAADSGFGAGHTMKGLDDVTKAVMNRVKSFAPFNERAARQVRSQTGGTEMLTKFGVAGFGIQMDPTLTASRGNDYAAVQNAINGRQSTHGALTAGGWCAPSETVYSYIADYTVDGLVSVPEVSAPRGGLNLTTGPARSTQGTALEDFGFTQTEAQAIAREVKTCEVIECPDFEEHRLEAVGYCIKVPLLTQAGYPELITDALRLANVMYAHKVNQRLINDMVGLSDPVAAAAFGASFTDTLEALSIIAVKARRKWNVGENAVMEVKMPQFVREVFRADMSRRAGLSLSDVATDQRIDAEFAARRLVVEYVSDWQELAGDDAIWPGSFDAMIFPAGTFIKAVEDVVNLSAVYDAASLSINEYTGVFFEQGMLLAKAGYGSSLVNIPICTAGATGASIFDCPAGSV